MCEVIVEVCVGACCQICSARTSRCHRHPFFIFQVLTFLIGFVPFILMLIGSGMTKIDFCFYPFTKTAFVLLGVNNMVNFLIVLKIVCSGSTIVNKNQNKVQVLCRMVEHYMTNGFYCFYFLVFVFFFVWVIIAHKQYANEPISSVCFTSYGGFIKMAYIFNLICLDIYVFGTLIVFIISFCVALMDPSQEQSNAPQPTGLEPESKNHHQTPSQSRGGSLVCWKDTLRRFSLGFGMLTGGIIPKNPHDVEEKPEIKSADGQQAHQQQQQLANMQQPQMNLHAQMQQQNQQNYNYNQNQQMPQMYQYQQQQMQQPTMGMGMGMQVNHQVVGNQQSYMNDGFNNSQYPMMGNYHQNNNNIVSHI